MVKFNGLISAVNELIEESNDSTKIIPGHGEICGINDLIKYKELLVIIEERIRNGIRDNLTLEEIREVDPYRDLDIVTGKFFDLERAYLDVQEYLESGNSIHSWIE